MGILDQIITDLHSYYQTPVLDDPLEVDDDKVGSNSDHLMVRLVPLNTVNNHKIKVTKKIEYRPLTDAGYKIMEQELKSAEWEYLENDGGVEEQMERFQNDLFTIFDCSFPQRTKLISNK